MFFSSIILYFFIIIFNSYYCSCKLLRSLEFINSNSFHSSQTMIMHGLKNRQKYILNNKILSPQYNHTEILIKSIPNNISISNAYQFIFGLYPIKTGKTLPKNFPIQRSLPPFENISYNYEKLNEDILPLQMQIVPVHELLNDYDNLENNCDFYSNLLIENYNKVENKFRREQLLFDIKNQLKNVWEINNINKINDFNLTQQVLEILNNKKIDINDISYNNFMKNISLISDHFILTNCCTIEKQKLLLSNQFITIIDSYIDITTKPSNSNLKYIVYFLNDYLFTSILTTLNLTNSECLYDIIKGKNINYNDCINGFSKLCSNLIIEIHQENENFNLILIFNGIIIKNITNILEFKNNLQNFYNINFKIDCKIEDNSQSNGISFLQNKKLKEAESELEKNYEFVILLIIVEAIGIVFTTILIIMRKNEII